MVGLKQLSLGSGNNLIVIVSGTHVNNSSSSSRERDGLSEGNNSDVRTMDNRIIIESEENLKDIFLCFTTYQGLRRKCVLKDAV